MYKWMVKMFIFFLLLLLPPFHFNIIKICKHIRFSILLLFYILPQSSIVISCAILSWFAFWFFTFMDFASLAMRRINAHCFFSFRGRSFIFCLGGGRGTFYIWKCFGIFFSLSASIKSTLENLHIKYNTNGKMTAANHLRTG